MAKASADFSQAVEEVKQWNKALTSDSDLRASIGSDSGPPHMRQVSRQFPPETAKLTTPAKGPLSLAKPRPTAEDYRSPEVDGTSFLARRIQPSCFKGLLTRV